MPQRKPIEVILEEAVLHLDPNKPHYFVLITNMPFVRGMQKALVITDAKPKFQAEAIKEAVERALHIYKQPRKKRTRKRKPKTAWERITKEGGL